MAGLPAEVEYDLNSLIDQQVHDLLNAGAHEGYVHPKGLLCGGLAFSDVFAEYFGWKGACSDKAETSGIAYR